MSSGLQRRRVAGGEASSSTNLPASSSSPNLNDGSRHTESFVDEKGRKVAYDPDDINSTVDASTGHPRLTLMEEVLLLGLKDAEGYLSFWNDNISYALRGCILMELAFRGKIAMTSDPARRRLGLCDRQVEILDDKLTGEALLDETIKLMKTSEPLSVGTWIDYLSGETWNLTRISYQLKQVRERLAKGLVDKGILRTEKRNFILFDMATHPLADLAAKEDLKRRVIHLLTSRTIALPSTQHFPDNTQFKHLRSIALVSGAYAATVLENVLTSLSYEGREQAFEQADNIVNEYSEWPFRASAPGTKSRVAENLAEEVQKEVEEAGSQCELQLEVIAAVLSVYAKLESIL